MTSFITDEQFETVITKQNTEGPALQWKELPLNVILKIVDRKYVNVNNTPAMILMLVDRNDTIYKVWTPERLCEELCRNYNNDAYSIYLKSKGAKESKNDIGRWYYAYEIIKTL